ncbi:HNH endonuclease [Dyadobacter psychrotolerans]|uniref:HNH endonuclease n=1 Tax=Dyadobacter psychrotolerans TaxID=2541721 RepID=A0A4V2Z3A3_9BACT|nr:HNH endonuclease signature motif containing protein [Dyadobacter psychrotolerans]TDE11958.1 HNH endonuclease [Dyadobacter psychrotolerans]
MSRASDYVTEFMRKQVAEAAGFQCEYCLIHEKDAYFGCEIDHVVSIKHGGSSVLQNLAYSCMICNLYKGSDLGSITETGKLIRFYNPRIDNWNEHFLIQGNAIIPVNEIGKVTARIFRFNEIERRMERDALQEIGLYPKRN